MAQFHNAATNFAHLASGRQALAIGTHNLAQNYDKRISLPQNWTDNDAKKKKKKNRLHVRFACKRYIQAMITKYDTADLTECVSKVSFRACLQRYSQADNNQIKPKCRRRGNLSYNVTFSNKHIHLLT